MKIERGIAQWCVLSPNLFAFYSEINGNINTIRYADDTDLTAGTEKKIFSAF